MNSLEILFLVCLAVNYSRVSIEQNDLNEIKQFKCEGVKINE
jgi:hypothetical protein